MKHRSSMMGLGKRCEVSMWIPAENYVEAAAERTDGMVDYFRVAVRGMDWLKADDFLHMLVRSAYLQGAIDAANVAAQMGDPPKEKP